MRYLATICVLFICAVSLDSQIAPGALHRLIGNPSSASSIPNPTNIISGLNWWWVASDMPVGITVSNQWIDRCQNWNSWQMGTASLRPTNSLKGVRFNGAQMLTNVQIDLTAHNRGIMWALFTHDAAGNQFIANQHEGRGLSIDASGNYKYWGGGITAVIGPIPAGKTNDVSVVWNTSGTNVVYYTNGIPGLTNAATQVAPNRMGAFDGPTYPLNGTIIEVFYSTNSATDAQMMQMHQYATNTYGAFP